MSSEPIRAEESESQAQIVGTEQAFLNALDKKLWTAADKLRSNLDAT